MKRLLLVALIATITLAFAGAAFATPINGWYIKRTGPATHLWVDVNGKKTDTKYSTYSARLYENKKIVKEYQAYALTPSLDQNAKKGHTLVSADDYFSSIGKTDELAAITRHFQISHFIQQNSSLSNNEMQVYQQFLMLSIWEVMIDGVDNFDLFSGNLKLNDKEKKQFEWFLSTQEHYASIFDSNDFMEHNYEFYVLVNSKNGADMLIFEYDLRAPAVPVPGAVWLMGTGVAGLVALRRKKAGQ